jgi:hypothetical protein
LRHLAHATRRLRRLAAEFKRKCFRDSNNAILDCGNAMTLIMEPASHVGSHAPNSDKSNVRHARTPSVLSEEVIVSLICLTAWTTVKDDLSLTEREEGH